MTWLCNTKSLREVRPPTFQLAVLALVANLCYSAPLLAEMMVRSFTPGAGCFRWRSVLWVFGTVLAILLKNYWIADEIYPYVR